jgi:hypothetical protein
LEDGSLQLSRSILRKAWPLLDINVKERTVDGGWAIHHEDVTELEAINYGHTSSYLEGWSPFYRKAVQDASSAVGPFTQNGYKWWHCSALGGWAMLSGDTVAVAMVFGKNDNGTSNYTSVPKCYFNRNDYGTTSNVNTLLPAIESDWPNDSTLVQHLIIVAGAPADVETRANNLVDGVQPPELIIPPTDANED